MSMWACSCCHIYTLETYMLSIAKSQSVLLSFLIESIEAIDGIPELFFLIT